MGMAELWTLARSLRLVGASVVNIVGFFTLLSTWGFFYLKTSIYAMHAAVIIRLHILKIENGRETA